MISLEEHNRIRHSFHSNDPIKNGIACPKCGNELLDSNPMMTLTSYPPQKSTHCNSCDYTGYRLA